MTRSCVLLGEMSNAPEFHSAAFLLVICLMREAGAYILERPSKGSLVTPLAIVSSPSADAVSCFIGRAGPLPSLDSQSRLDGVCLGPLVHALQEGTAGHQEPVGGRHTLLHTKPSPNLVAEKSNSFCCCFSRGWAQLWVSDAGVTISGNGAGVIRRFSHSRVW